MQAHIIENLSYPLRDNLVEYYTTSEFISNLNRIFYGKYLYNLQMPNIKNGIGILRRVFLDFWLRHGGLSGSADKVKFRLQVSLEQGFTRATAWDCQNDSFYGISR